MNKVMEYLQAHASHNSIIGLMSAKGKEKFYENLGSGMTMFWAHNKTNA